MEFLSKCILFHLSVKTSYSFNSVIQLNSCWALPAKIFPNSTLASFRTYPLMISHRISSITASRNLDRLNFFFFKQKSNSDRKCICTFRHERMSSKILLVSQFKLPEGLQVIWSNGYSQRSTSQWYQRLISENLSPRILPLYPPFPFAQAPPAKKGRLFWGRECTNTSLKC